MAMGEGGDEGEERRRNRGEGRQGQLKMRAVVCLLLSVLYAVTLVYMRMAAEAAQQRRQLASDTTQASNISI